MTLIEQLYFSSVFALLALSLLFRTVFAFVEDPRAKRISVRISEFSLAAVLALSTAFVFVKAVIR